MLPRKKLGLGPGGYGGLWVDTLSRNFLHTKANKTAEAVSMGTKMNGESLMWMMSGKNEMQA